MITFSRAGGMRAPQFRESLEIADDGSFEMWRSVSMASALPSPVGSFAGSLGPAQLKAVKAAAMQAAAAGPMKATVTPDSPVDRIQVDGVAATLGIHNAADGPWKAIVALLRALLKDLTDHPLAAISLQLDGGARLEHHGSEPLELDLSKLTIKATHWRDRDSEGQWTGTLADSGKVSAGAGWSLELPFDHGFELKAGDRITASVTFSAQNKDKMVPVGLQTP